MEEWNDGAMESWKNGMMEQWNHGVTGDFKTMVSYRLPAYHLPNVPIFKNSIFPVCSPFLSGKFTTVRSCKETNNLLI